MKEPNPIKSPFTVFLDGAGTVNGRFKQKYHWVEESFVFDKQTGKQSVLPSSDEYIESSVKKNYIKGFWYFFIAILCIVTLRLGYIQLMRGNHYAILATNNRERIIPIPAERGLIYDRFDQQLTQNIPSFSLALTPQDLPRSTAERQRMVSELALLTGEDEDHIAMLIEQYGSYSYESIVIKEYLDYETALRLQIKSSGLPGISIQRGSKRLYSYLGAIPTTTSTPHSLSHIIGYLGKLSPDDLATKYSDGYLPSDSLGKTGLEYSYETLLRGTYGKKRIEVDARGKEQAVLEEEAPIPGKHLVLSVDMEMQDALERIMKEEMQKRGVTRGVGIVTQPKTGEILSMVSIPSFDNNDFSGGITEAQYRDYAQNPDTPLFNRAIGGAYPSGSTIKPVIAAAALQEGIVTATTAFLSVGGIAVSQWFFPDWQAGGHGMTDVRKSLAQSVNTYYYIIGGGFNDTEGLGVERIHRYLQAFGFASALGIDLPGEAAGFTPTIEWKERTKGERWYIGDTYNLSIGQGDLLVTPLQIAMMTATIANGGTRYKPHIVQKIVDPATKEEQPILPEILDTDMISPVYMNSIRLGMRDCVTIGSCQRLSLLPFSSAGKTGTAQWSSTKKPHAWFTSFAPFENPQITVTILIEEGEGGSLISAPIAYQFYRWWDEHRY